MFFHSRIGLFFYLSHFTPYIIYTFFFIFKYKSQSKFFSLGLNGKTTALKLLILFFQIFRGNFLFRFYINHLQSFIFMFVVFFFIHSFTYFLSRQFNYLFSFPFERPSAKDIPIKKIYCVFYGKHQLSVLFLINVYNIFSYIINVYCSVTY